MDCYAIGLPVCLVDDANVDNECRTNRRYRLELGRDYQLLHLKEVIRQLYTSDMSLENSHLHGMRKTFQPIYSGLELTKYPCMCQVPTMQKDITIWNGKGVTMCIADTYESRPVGTRNVGHVVWIILRMNNGYL